VHDTFHEIIPGQLCTPIRCIDLEISCGLRENKRREMLTFEVVSFDIEYNCILWRPFLLKFMVVVHTAYATIMMLGPKGVITLKYDLRDALACENATLTHTGWFSENEAHELAAKVAKTHGGSTSIITWRKHSDQTSGAQAANRQYTPTASREEEHVRWLHIKSAHRRSAEG
jgi:hypothetical protein